MDDSQARSQRVKCGEVTLECTVAGKEDRPLVVLLHGFPDSRHAWRHQIDALSGDYLVVAPNLRGYGGSDRPDGIASYRLDRLATDVRELVRAMKKTRAHIVGHDWGGAIAWALAIDDERVAKGATDVAGVAADRGRVVDKLVVLNCPHPARFERVLRLDPAQQARSAYFGFFLLPLVPEWLLSFGDFALLEGLVQHSLGDRELEDVFGPDHRDQRSEALRDERSLNAAINYYRAAALYAGTMRARYAKGPPISSPTLLIWGDQDPALGPDLADDIDRYFGAGRPTIEKLRNCSHWAPQEEPTRVNALLLGFLGSHSTFPWDRPASSQAR